MGRGEGLWHSTSSRADSITWITDGIQGKGELPQAIESLLQRLFALRQALNDGARGCCKNITGPCGGLDLTDTTMSAQLARYPGDGRGYVRHRDTPVSAKRGEDVDRKITALYYLNPDWEPRMGGQLRIHLETEEVGESNQGGRGQTWDIEPVLDRLVLFRSDLVDHEVLPAFAPRLAVTMWFYGRNLGCPARAPALPAPVHAPAPLPLPSAPAPASAPISESFDPGDDTRRRVRPLPTSKADGSQHAVQASIFISIVSYRDPEANSTIVDLLARASNPSRLSIGLVWQLDLSVAEDQAMHAATPHGDVELRGGHVRSVLMPAADAAGPSWARRVAQSLWAGEKYFLQIDSHTRFRPGWDSYLICTLQRCPSFKPILTTYPVGYQLPHRIPAGETRPTLLVPDGFGADDGMLRQTGRLMLRKARDPIPSPLWASGFSFSGSALLFEVPCDPGLRHVFFGEEISMAARMYTRGWDFFAPPQTVVYHLWSRAHRPSFRQVSTRETRGEETRAKKRIWKLLGIDASSPAEAWEGRSDAVEDAATSGYDSPDLYGLGKVRTLQSFEDRVGVDLRSSTMKTPDARNGGRQSSDFNDSIALGLEGVLEILDKVGIGDNVSNACRGSCNVGPSALGTQEADTD